MANFVLPSPEGLKLYIMGWRKIYREQKEKIKLKRENTMGVRKEKNRGRKKQIKSLCGDYSVPNMGTDINSPVQDTRAEMLAKNNLSDRKECFAAEVGITNFRPSQLFSMAKAKK